MSLPGQPGRNPIAGLAHHPQPGRTPLQARVDRELDLADGRLAVAVGDLRNEAYEPVTYAKDLDLLGVVVAVLRRL